MWHRGSTNSNATNLVAIKAVPDSSILTTISNLDKLFPGADRLDHYRHASPI